MRNHRDLVLLVLVALIVVIPIVINNISTKTISSLNNVEYSIGSYDSSFSDNSYLTTEISVMSADVLWYPSDVIINISITCFLDSTYSDDALLNVTNIDLRYIIDDVHYNLGDYYGGVMQLVSNETGILTYKQEHSLNVSDYAWGWYSDFMEINSKLQGNLGFIIALTIPGPAHNLRISNFRSYDIDGWNSKETPLTLDYPYYRFLVLSNYLIFIIAPTMMYLVFIGVDEFLSAIFKSQSLNKWDYRKHPTFHLVISLYSAVSFMIFGALMVSFSQGYLLDSLNQISLGVYSSIMLLIFGTPLFILGFVLIYGLGKIKVGWEAKKILVSTSAAPVLYLEGFAINSGIYSLHIPFIQLIGCIVSFIGILFGIIGLRKWSVSTTEERDSFKDCIWHFLKLLLPSMISFIVLLLSFGMLGFF